MGIYYYESRKTNYPPYLAHHGVKGMKWGVRHDPMPTSMYGAQSHYVNSYMDTKSRANKTYRQDAGAIRRQRKAGAISDSQYRSQMSAARGTRRRTKSEGKLNARKKYYSEVSQGRGIAGSVLLHVGGQKVAKMAQKKWGRAYD